MKKIFFSLALLTVLPGIVSAQQGNKDTASASRQLDSVILISYLNQNIIRPLPVVQGTYIFSGKKTEMIDLAQIPADITNKTGRQVFSKIPGVFVYDMDGAGNQVNIAARGLDPHRGWEFNIRKDGIITNSDMYGYPASHYSMPLESIGRIELVRGTGSLQYGAQFGGMLNYITKQGDTTRPFSFESINTAGSFNLLSTYNAIGGKSGKFKYYAYMHKKSRGGYRDNEHTDSEAEAIILSYEATRFSIRAEWARSKYLYRIPGPLTDSMFYADPTQATRSRNYFSPDIHVPSITLNWQIAAQTKLQLVTSAVLGRRNSVQYDKPTNIRDTINTSTLQYNNRQVDIDRFNSYTAELRLLQEYHLGKQTSILSAGAQYMNNDLHRTQLGKGTTGSDYDLTLLDPAWGRDVHLKTHNIALFVENKFQLLSNLSVNVGGRVESGQTDMSGTIVYYPDNAIPVTIKHRFPLLGINASYKIKEKNIEIYAGWSQAYHPMLFKDLIPGSLFEKVDPNIKDAKGYNAELGFRGNWRFLRWDVNGFILRYDNRFGTLAQTDNTGTFYTYRTNIGNSLTKGLEMLIQADWLLNGRTGLSFFTSTAFVHARYKNAIVKSGNSNINVNGNKVESAPDLISRNGASVRYKKASFSILYSYTSESFADALNTVEPLKSTGAVGLVPAYGIMDMNAAYRFSKNLEARVNVNNVMNKQYFTKRPTFYPGPGVWPSEGRNFSVSFVVRL
jgi:Fe(3+) dicitrate transport protein